MRVLGWSGRIYSKKRFNKREIYSGQGSLMMIEPNTPAISKKQQKLQKLKQVPVEKIRKLPALIVDIPIGELSLKDSHRTIYVLSSTLVQAQKATNQVADIFERRESGIKKLIEKYETNRETNIETVLNDLKELIKISESVQAKPSEKN